MSLQKNSAYIILSGGMDSTLAALYAIKEFSSVMAIFFDWGQKAINEERIAVSKVCEKLNIKNIYEIQALLNKWVKSSLTNDDINQFSKANIIVSERNLVFLALAASYARTQGGGTLIVGFNKDDLGYDTTERFVKMFNEILKEENRDLKKLFLSSKKIELGTELCLYAPLIDKDKKQIKKELKEADLFNMTYSCYRAGGPCNKCPACVNRNKA